MIIKSITQDDIDFIIQQINSITDSRIYELPSDYVERVRYLPPELTPMPGKFSFDKCPFHREILDCLSPTSPTQEVALMKGVQIMATTAILENKLAYNIGCDPKPQLYVSADKELVTTGMKTKVERMIDTCNLRDLIFSQTGKKRSTGDTITEKEYPGGFLHAIGARNPGKLRSMSYPNILFDEIDGFPDKLGKEGDPITIAKNRTNAYATKRKILYLSTPLIMQSSKIYFLYKKGDQRNYFIPCKHCGEMQVLRWHGVDENKNQYGIVFELTKKFQPDYKTVGYKCQYCGKIMKNHDKSIFMNQGEWRPTAISELPLFRSYWLNTLYSPPGMYSWENIVQDWSECWDLEKNRMKDKEKTKTFYNLKRGLPWEETGSSIKYEKSVLHRRSGFFLSSIPENIMIRDTGSVALLLTCTVDVQHDGIFIHTIAWTFGGQSWTIDFFKIDAEERDIADVKSKLWTELDKYIIEKTYTSESGKNYRIINTFIDSGWGKYSDIVYEFCKGYSSGVYAIKGEEWIKPGLTYRMFSKETLEKAGLPSAYNINTTKIKDRIARYMGQLMWDSGQLQPDWYPNFPEDLHDDFFRMYEAEYRVEVHDKDTGQFKYIRWKQTQGADNHAFDTTVYNFASLELVADRTCREELGLKTLSWSDFWEYCKTGAFYY